MTLFVQLNPTIPLDTPKGRGYAHFVIDYSQEHHLMWGVFLDDGGACWIFENPEVRLRPNPTLGRGGGEKAREVGEAAVGSAFAASVLGQKRNPPP